MAEKAVVSAVAALAGLCVGAGVTYVFLGQRFEAEKARIVAEASSTREKILTDAKTEKEQLANEARQQIAAIAAQAAAQTQKLQQEQSALQKPDLPVRVDFRRAMMGPRVAVVANTSRRELALAVEISSPATKQSKTMRLVIPATRDMLTPAKLEIGHSEGWAFASGDELRLEPIQNFVCEA
jgi:hypothetical protein